jgi:hypothetical protein
VKTVSRGLSDGELEGRGRTRKRHPKPNQRPKQLAMMVLFRTKAADNFRKEGSAPDQRSLETGYRAKWSFLQP